MSKESFKSLDRLPPSSYRKGEGGLRLKGKLKSSQTNLPLLTVIMATYNSISSLEFTLKSIIEQSYSNLELLVIDGGSTNGTVNLLKKYNNKIDYWVSEADKGIADAFNKGVRLARGKFINFQGDGDGFIEKNSVLHLRLADYQEFDLISAQVARVDQNDKIAFVTRAQKCFKKESLLYRMSLPHQGLLTSLDFFKKYGLFKTDARYAMDYELLLRAYKDFPKVKVIEQVLAKWREDGLGTGRTYDVLREYRRIKSENKVAHVLTISLIHYWSVTKYTLKFLFLKLGRV